MRICVYLGSSAGTLPIYREAAEQFGTLLARRGIGLVYGGGTVGLMGVIADAVCAAGGEVIGVIPEALRAREHDHQGITELHVVQTMHERKKAFTDLSDGFLTLPGGVGTMDELWEAVSWAQLGYHDKPVGLLNAFGFYDGLIEFYRHMAETGFVRAAHRDIIIVENELDALFERMANHVPHTPIFSMSASQL